MCGIFFSINKGSQFPADDNTLIALKARGPDSQKSLEIRLPVPESEDLCLTFASSVLALRGGHVQDQPLVDSPSGSVLCWNGEAWKIQGQPVQGNDATQVFRLLLKASAKSKTESSPHIAQVLSAIDGPFAFVYYDALTSTIYYGRDRLGRRSLLVGHSPDTQQLLTLCSTRVQSMLPAQVEVSTDAIHCLSVSQGKIFHTNIVWEAPLPLINMSLPCTEPLSASPTRESIQQLKYHLQNSICLRVTDIPDHAHIPLATTSAKVAVLFSGGLDCTLLARLVHDLLPPNESIDLLNVAFENPRAMAAINVKDQSPYELCPDRVTGRSSFDELCNICPGRLWRFVAVNIPYAECVSHQPAILDLIYPHNTEMDLSIAMALYFAARGQGEAFTTVDSSCPEVTSYTSTARVLLSGLGADELFAGYSRHAAAFARGGFASLVNELELDYVRIGTRNLGRDDRVMSNWGREVRYPFLDEDFVRFSLQLPIWEKAGFRPGRTIPKHYEDSKRAETSADLEPAKLLLRLVAWDQGMRRAASERKRAIQFGAKTAKMSVGKGRTKGTDLVNAVSWA